MRRTVPAEYVSPVGFEKRGTHHIPRIPGSPATSASTRSMSGPSPVMGTGIIPMPRSSQIPKCRS